MSLFQKIRRSTVGGQSTTRAKPADAVPTQPRQSEDIKVADEATPLVPEEILKPHSVSELDPEELEPIGEVKSNWDTPKLSEIGSPRSVRSSSVSKRSNATEGTLMRFQNRFPTINEPMIDYHNCALEKEILRQGRIYVTASAICFYAKIFGNELKQVIYFKEITEIEKANTAGLFANAIRIHVGETKYFFASFLKRDTVHEQLSDLWERSKKPPTVEISTDLRDIRSSPIKELINVLTSPLKETADTPMSDKSDTVKKILVILFILPLILSSLVYIPFLKSPLLAEHKIHDLLKDISKEKEFHANAFLNEKNALNTQLSALSNKINRPF